MARLARVVVPGLPHHVTQRGNRRQRTFFGEDDYRAYRALLAAPRRRAGVACCAYCLVPDHVHLNLTPETVASLARGTRGPGVIRNGPGSHEALLAYMAKRREEIWEGRTGRPQPPIRQGTAGSSSNQRLCRGRWPIRMKSNTCAAIFPCLPPEFRMSSPVLSWVAVFDR